MITEIIKQIKDAQSKETDKSVIKGLQKALMIVLEVDLKTCIKETEEFKTKIKAL